MVERTFFITDAWYDTYDETDEDSFEDQYGYKPIRRTTQV